MQTIRTGKEVGLCSLAICERHLYFASRFLFTDALQLHSVSDFDAFGLAFFDQHPLDLAPVDSHCGESIVLSASVVECHYPPTLGVAQMELLVGVSNGLEFFEDS